MKRTYAKRETRYSYLILFTLVPTLVPINSNRLRVKAERKKAERKKSERNKPEQTRTEQNKTRRKRKTKQGENIQNARSTDTRQVSI